MREPSDVPASILEHATRVYRFALRLTGDSNDAEDLTQETLLRAWRRKHRLRQPEAARTWLLRIAANAWRDQLRRAARRLASRSEDSSEPIDEDSPEQILQQREELGEVLLEIDQLPPRQRQVLYLSAFEDLSQKEIARVLGINRSAVKSSLAVARATLREKFIDP